MINYNDDIKAKRFQAEGDVYVIIIL